MSTAKTIETATIGTGSDAAAPLPVWAQPAWTGEAGTRRVDPRSEVPMSFDVAGVGYRVGPRGAVVTRDGIARPVPMSAFQGVAARASEAADGTVTVTLELMHAEPGLSVPVLVARDLDDVAADWRDWARRSGLPMLMVEGDGSVEVLDAAPRPGVDPAHDRRRRTTRRPRFLVRRSVGIGVTMRIEGREMFRRD